MAYEKYIFITNGMGGSGKDTFAEILDDFIPVYKVSSIDVIKDLASSFGWDGGKTEKDRKFLSDLKVLATEYSDLPFKSIFHEVRWFKTSSSYHYVDGSVMLIDIREPDEIERAKVTFGAETILIKNDRVPFISSNMADANVYNYEYDYVIENNGTLEEFRETIKKFAEERFNVKGE